MKSGVILVINGVGMEPVGFDSALRWFGHVREVLGLQNRPVVWMWRANHVLPISAQIFEGIVGPNERVGIHESIGGAFGAAALAALFQRPVRFFSGPVESQPRWSINMVRPQHPGHEPIVENGIVSVVPYGPYWGTVGHTTSELIKRQINPTGYIGPRVSCVVVDIDNRDTARNEAGLETLGKVVSGMLIDPFQLLDQAAEAAGEAPPSYPSRLYSKEIGV